MLSGDIYSLIYLRNFFAIVFVIVPDLHSLSSMTKIFQNPFLCMIVVYTRDRCHAVILDPLFSYIQMFHNFG